MSLCIFIVIGDPFTCSSGFNQFNQVTFCVWISDGCHMYVMVFLVFNDLRRVVFVCFVGIDRIVDHPNFLFIIQSDHLLQRLKNSLLGVVCFKHFISDLFYVINICPYNVGICLSQCHLIYQYDALLVNMFLS